MKSFLSEILFGASVLDGGSKRARRAFKLARASFLISICILFFLIINLIIHSK